MAFLVGLIIAGEFTPAPVVSTAHRRRPAPRRTGVRAGASAPRPALVNFADVAERINPAVVNIDATSKAPRARRSGRSRPRTDDP